MRQRPGVRQARGEDAFMQTPPDKTDACGLRLRSLAGSTVLHGICIVAATVGTWRQLTDADWRSARATPMSATVTLQTPPAPTAPPPLPLPPVVREATSTELPCHTPPPLPFEPADEAASEPMLADVVEASFDAAVWLTSLRAAPPAATAPAGLPPQVSPPEATQPEVTPVTAPQATDSTAAATVPPSPLAGENEPPRYPFVAWRRGIEGTVVVGLDIDRDGSVTATRLLDSSGSHLLDAAALAQLRTWRFAPATGGAPDLRTSRQTVVFRLRNQ